MTSQPASGQPAAVICRRPGCGAPLPASGRGRTRQFCSDDCARRYHNDARIPVAAAAPLTSGTDPLAALESLLRQAVVHARAAAEQAASLDPAAVRAQVAEAEAARRRAEAAAVTAAAREAEARQETQALAEALAAAREAAQDAADGARTAAGELDQLRSDTAAQITAITDRAGEQSAAARAGADRCARERDDALAAAAQARHGADTEISRARQAETDARNETAQARADAARERDSLRDSCQAQLAAACALTQAERERAERAEAQPETGRADRRTLTSHITSTASDNGPQPGPQPRSGEARSK